MKFLKNDLLKKLIIILIVLLLFNSVFPTLIYAVDLGGILLQPLYWLLLANIIPSDLTFGLAIRLQNIDFSEIGNNSEDIIDQNGNWRSFSSYFIGPDSIFSGKIKSLNANVFENISGRGDILTNVTKGVAKFYVILRNICSMVMLIGLVFTGIRILLSSNIPTKKTQYLMILQDWIIGMALLIFSHIIMILIFEVTDAIVITLGKSFGSDSIKWQLIKQMGGSFDSTTQLLALMMYIWVQWLTIVFAIAYFKRYFWTCILVVFAPVMSVMYAFGQQTKQIYTNWLKEFIMNAMIQPFHIVVYTVLITIPLQITNGGSWNWSWENGTELIYGLMAMSMIRPAEKYMRRMFGFDKGVANMASYDSGKQTIDAGVKAIGTAVKAAVGIAATVATAGAAAGAIGAAGAAGAAGSAAGAAGSAAGGASGVLGSGASNALGALGEAGEALGEGGEVLGQLGQGNGLLGAGQDLNGYDRNAFGHYFNPYIDEYDPNYIPEGLGTGIDQDDFSDGDIKALTDGIKQNMDEADDKKAIASGETPEEFMKSLRANSEAHGENLTDAEVAERVGSENLAGMLKEAGFSEDAISKYLGTNQNDGQGNFNTSSINITAGSVNMQGELGKGVEQTEIKEAKIEEVTDEKGEEKEEITLEAPVGEANFGEIFKDLGGIEQIGDLGVGLYEGAHSLADTLYVDGGAPTNEWKGTAQLMQANIKDSREKRKENMDQEKTAFATNKLNISYMADLNMPKMQEIYKGKSEAYIRDKAEEKAKSDLVKMSEYVPYGVTDVSVAHKLYQVQKNNGFTPEQTIKHEAGYAKLNSNKDMVAKINLSGSFERNDYKTVEEAIPNARTYYDNGYTQVDEMAWVDKIAKSLGKSPEFAMRVDQTLKKKGGKINYSGKNAEMKKLIDDINSSYGG